MLSPSGGIGRGREKADLCRSSWTCRGRTTLAAFPGKGRSPGPPTASSVPSPHRCHRPFFTPAACARSSRLRRGGGGSGSRCPRSPTPLGRAGACEPLAEVTTGGAGRWKIPVPAADKQGGDGQSGPRSRAGGEGRGVPPPWPAARPAAALAPGAPSPGGRRPRQSARRGPGGPGEGGGGAPSGEGTGPPAGSGLRGRSREQGPPGQDAGAAAGQSFCPASSVPRARPPPAPLGSSRPRVHSQARTLSHTGTPPLARRVTHTLRVAHTLPRLARAVSHAHRFPRALAASRTGARPSPVGARRLSRIRRFPRAGHVPPLTPGLCRTATQRTRSQ